MEMSSRYSFLPVVSDTSTSVELTSRKNAVCITDCRFARHEQSSASKQAPARTWPHLAQSRAVIQPKELHTMLPAASCSSTSELVPKSEVVGRSLHGSPPQPRKHGVTQPVAQLAVVPVKGAEQLVAQQVAARVG